MAANQKHGLCNRLGRPSRVIGLQQTGVFGDKLLRNKPPNTKRYLEVICLTPSPEKSATRSFKNGP